MLRIYDVFTTTRAKGERESERDLCQDVIRVYFCSAIKTSQPLFAFDA